MAYLVLLTTVLAVGTAGVAHLLVEEGQSPMNRLREWLRWCLKRVPVVLALFPRLSTWVFPKDEAQQTLLAAEEATFKARIESLGAATKAAALEERQTTLANRRGEKLAKLGTTVSYVVVFLLSLVGFPFVVMGSYTMKKQVINDFVGDAQLLKGVEIALGDQVLVLKMAEITTYGLIGFDLIFGVMLSFGYEGRRDVKANRNTEHKGLYNFLFYFSLLCVCALVGLEGYLGAYRAELQNDSGFQKAWMVIISMLYPIGTVVVGFLLKFTLRQILGLFAFLFRLVGGLIAVLFLIVLVGITLLFVLFTGIVLVLAFLLLNAIKMMPKPKAKPDAEDNTGNDTNISKGA